MMLNKKNLSKGVLLFSLVAGLGGCSMLDVLQDKAVKIDGTVFKYNDVGEIEMTQAQMTELEENGSIVRVKHVATDGALILDPEEMTLLTQDRSIFFTKLDKVSASGEVSMLVKKGSLRENIERIMADSGWSNLTWDLNFDFHVAKPFVVAGADMPSIIVEALNDFPVYVNFDDINKSITVSKK